jgi:hypothetical protein
VNRKVLYYVERYSQISETYIENELRALSPDTEVRIISLKAPDLPCDEHLPYRIIRSREDLEEVIADFRPDVIHGHYMTMVDKLTLAAHIAGVPFTVRAHSFDILGPMTERLPMLTKLVNSKYCHGILTFPFTVPWMVRAGYDPAKLHGCFPVANVARFEDRGENGKAVLNVGACLPKKSMDLYLQIAARLPERQFNLYALGYNVGRIGQLNQDLGKPVTVVPPVQPEAMLPEYKKHEWLLYTGSTQLKTVGWPLAVAEAQAAGVGVCMQNVRPDLKDYVGDAGFLFDTIEEAVKIVSQPFPRELRERGFELARRSDMKGHIHLLEDLWRSVA